MMKNITLKQVLRQHALLGCIALLPLSPVYSQADNQQIAFPGAEGWGRFATGGRTTDPAIGSKVYYVTSLDDYLSSEEPIEGTLRWALTTGDDTPRTILFKVGGTINLKERLKCPRPNVTIAGQSAPGGGICISGANIYIHSKNFIVRYIRFRAGDLSGSNYSAKYNHRSLLFQLVDGRKRDNVRQQIHYYAMVYIERTALCIQA